MFNTQLYSPVEEISHPILMDKQVKLFIKRDDLIHPFISGNKWRKLKYNLLKAQTGGKKHLITFGGAWSNHLLATACAAATFGFKSTGFVRGETVENEMLFLCRMFGMNLKFVSRENYRNKQALYNQLYDQDKETYFIDEGGAGLEAVQGCAELINELEQPFDHLFCAAGTGTTAAGIINGLLQKQLTTQVHVIPVLKGADYLQQEIKQLLLTPAHFHFHTNYHFGGYAKTQNNLLNFIQHFSTTSGILLDPVYTGKMFYALFDLVEKGTFTAGSKLLAIHTGGLFGLLGMKDKFNIINKYSF